MYPGSAQAKRSIIFESGDCKPNRGCSGKVDSGQKEIAQVPHKVQTREDKDNRPCADRKAGRTNETDPSPTIITPDLYTDLALENEYPRESAKQLKSIGRQESTAS
jgi:hypothetical protein